MPPTSSTTVGGSGICCGVTAESPGGSMPAGGPAKGGMCALAVSDALGGSSTACTQRVGADLVVILNPRCTGSTTSSVPITTPSTSTSYSTGTATAFKPGGPATVFGSGMTTT